MGTGRSAGGNGAMKILWIPHTGWHIPQRAHLFCRQLAERHEVHATDWVADFTKLSDYFSRRYLRNFTYRRWQDRGITVHGIPRISPAIMSASLRRFNQRVFSSYVQRIIVDYGIDVVVGTFVVPPPKAKRLIFDLFDENSAYWRVYRGRPDYAAEIERIEQDYLEKADRIVAVSSVLKDSIISKVDGIPEDRITIIPNAVDVARLNSADGAGVRRRYGLENKRIVGLVSALGEFTGLLRLLEAFSLLKEDDIALMVVGDGPVLQAGKDYVASLGLENIIFTGKVPFSQVYDYFKAIDVGVVPFDKNAFTDAASPIKLIEHSAAGKMVVSTNLTEVERMGFPNVVLAQQNPLSIAEGISIALRREYIAPKNLNDYDIRSAVDSFEKLLHG